MNEALRSELRAIGGATLEVLDIPARGPSPTTLVLLHEGLGSVSVWREFPFRLAEVTGLRTVVYSRRGYGASSPAGLPRPVRFMHDEASGDLPALLHALAIEDLVLVGHSDGASIALLYASSRSKDAGLRAVVALAPHVFVEDVAITSIAKAREAYATTDLRARLARHHGANVDCAFRGWNDVWLAPEFRGWNIEAAVAEIEVPVLVIQGEDDEYGTLAQVDTIERRLAPSVPFERAIFPACGHSPHRDATALTLERIASFVARYQG